MDTIQRINLKNYIKAIHDEDIHNFFIDKINVITIQSNNDEFRVVINDKYIIFQKGDQIEYIIDTIDKYIVKENQKERMRKILGDDNKVDEKFLQQCRAETNNIFRNEINYDYRTNLEKLKERYLDNIKGIESQENEKYQSIEYCIGLKGGLKTAIRDITDMLEGLEM